YSGPQSQDNFFIKTNYILIFPYTRRGLLHLLRSCLFRNLRQAKLARTLQMLKFVLSLLNKFNWGHKNVIYPLQEKNARL
ncbi:MAG TPA: hypothetical protein VGP47_10565, partial [Parachlamydiaceae bacterium]|nr:hypothetical protein [Parachlamydiaceae bacterium]